MAKNIKIDFILLFVTFFLLLLGILILSSVSSSFSQERFGQPFYFISRQFLYGLIPGTILAALVFKIDLNFLRKWALVFLLINFLFLVLVFLPPFGTKIKGASRWVNLGPISFQPSEFLKLTFILYLASWLSKRTKKTFDQEIKFEETLFAFFLILILITIFLIFQPDLGTLGIILALAILIYFISQTPLKQNILIMIFLLLSFLFFIQIAPYRLARFSVFLNPEIDPLGLGYQIKQALIAIGSGGLFGQGLGLSIQKFGFLPQTLSDSIFAIFAEETGFFGTLFLISLFLIFFWRGFFISQRVNDRFFKFLAFGISSWILIQVFLNISSITGILPLTGVPLPFISYGGSALIAELMAVGILLNISKQT